MVPGILGALLLTLAASPSEKTDAGEAKAKVRRGEVLLSAGVPAGAKKEFEQAKRLTPGPCEECEWGLARALRELGKKREAVSSCDWIAENSGSETMRIKALNLKALILGAAGSNKASMDEAEATYRQLLLLKPDEANLSYNLALLLFRKGDKSAGMEALQRYLELAPDGEVALPARRILENPALAGKRFAPAFSLTARDGRKLSTASLAGHIVVLDFWATWCGPCVASLPELRRLTAEYPEERLVVISVSADEDKTAWEAFVEKERMGWPQYLDSDWKLRRLFGIRAYPTYLVIDGDGVFVESLRGMDSRHSIASRLRDAVGPALERPRKK